MQVMRAVFNCEKGKLAEIAAFGADEGVPMTLEIHEESDEGEEIVDGTVWSVMRLIGFVAQRGGAALNEAWTYEC